MYIGEPNLVRGTKKYFAQEDAEITVGHLYAKSNDWWNTLTHNNYLDKVRRSWSAYHGNYFDSSQGGHSISFGGEQGELVQMPVNHYRNIAEHVIRIITANRPTFSAHAANTDVKSSVQTKLANILLEYYMRDKGLENVIRLAVENAVVMGSGYIKMEWNSGIGDNYDYDPETATFRKEGDVEFKNISTYDVVFDSTAESPEYVDWLIVRSWKNKFALAAKYPEHAEKIKALRTKSDIYKYSLMGSAYDHTDHVPVYEFYHKKDEALPQGRYIQYLDDDIILFDGALPYDDIPVYRISPSDYLGAMFGYTQMFDLLPLQDAINTLASAAMTNLSTFAVQNVWVPRGANIDFNNLYGGMNFIEGNAVASGGVPGKPESLQLTHTPPELYNFLQTLEQWAETLGGINSVTRGNPEAHLRSGTSLALVQSQAIEFVSNLQQRYVRLIENLGTGLIKLLQVFAETPRVAQIVGKNNRTELKTFQGDDLSLINRVVVDVGNPLAATTAGRFEIGQQFMQYYPPEQLPPEKLMMVFNTGRLEHLTDGIGEQMFLIDDENEALIDGQMEVHAIITENHELHMKKHMEILSDVKLKNDPELVQRVLNHIQEHADLYNSNNPLLALNNPKFEQKMMAQLQHGAPGQPGQAGDMGLPPDPMAAGQAGTQIGPLPQTPPLPESPTGAPVLASQTSLQGI